MVASVLERAGIALVHNRAGANMAGGVASTLLDAAGRGAAIDGELGLFEVDEFWLDRVAPELAPRAIALGNLFRDQLDRYGELDTIADRWAALVAALPDDRAGPQRRRSPDRRPRPRPRRGELLRRAGRLSVAIGRDAARVGLQALPPLRGTPTSTTPSTSGTSGRYRCPQCGRHAARARLSPPSRSSCAGRARRASLCAPPQASATVTLPLPGLYNVYNALAAATLCLRLGIDAAAIAAGLETVSAAFGRAERIARRRRRALAAADQEPRGRQRGGAHARAGARARSTCSRILNDRTADGRDVSWIWDADLELLAGRVRRVTCAGTRAAELAVRLKYAGVDPERLHVVPRSG